LAQARYRFTAKLRVYGNLLAACIDRVTAALHEHHSGMGVNVAIDETRDGSTRGSGGESGSSSGSRCKAERVGRRRGVVLRPRFRRERSDSLRRDAAAGSSRLSWWVCASCIRCA